MADKKKKQNSKKQTDKKTKFVRAEDIKNPKLPKKNKIPKGVDRTLISNEGNIIMTYTFGDISDKKQKTAKRTTAAKKPSKQAKSKTKPAAKSAAKKLTAKAAPKRVAKAGKIAKPAKKKSNKKYE